MEDVHRILPVLHKDSSEYSYFGVYDGHGGRQIVDFLESALEENIAKEVQESDDAPMSERLTRAFLITDMQSKRLGITTSGATAVSALLYTKPEDVSTATPAQRILYVANAGDSRAVLVSSLYPSTLAPVSTDDIESGFVATRLSFDHKPEDPAEQQRIKDAGGFITRNRVLGILAVSRSFGDHGMKDFVTASPYVSETDLQACGDCPLLILACDGVWDVLSDQEAADLLLKDFKEKGPYEGAAELLVRTSIERGSADNVTAIVVFL